MQVISGDLIAAARKGEVDVIAHGCNCFNTQGAGIARQMAMVFETNMFPMELIGRGDKEKLGKIDYKKFYVSPATVYPENTSGIAQIVTCDFRSKLWVVNMYTQYYFDASKIQLNYPALEECLIKLNNTFKGQRVGLPYKIGCGLAGGDWSIVEQMIKDKLTGVEVKLYKL